MKNILKVIKNYSSPFLYPEEVLLGEQFFFGHREILVNCLDLNPQTLFLATIQHGWTTEEYALKRPKVQKKFRGQFAEFVWSNRIAKTLERNGRESVYAVGSPWAHLIKRVGFWDYDARDHTNNRPKLIYFPNHSHHGWVATLGAPFLDEFSEQFEITICLYWLDYLDPAVMSIFSNKKFKIVCCGYRGSSSGEIPWANVGGRTSFLLKLYEHINTADVVLCDEVGSAFWYALSLGKLVKLVKLGVEYDSWDRNSLDSKSRIIVDNQKLLQNGEVMLNFLDLKKEIRSQDVELAREELGWHETDRLRELVINTPGLLKKDKELPLELAEMQAQQIIRLQKPK